MLALTDVVDIRALLNGEDFIRLLGEDDIKLDRLGHAPKARHQRGASLMLNQLLLQKPEAWVIAHDWILNRVILDDSFRPALQYVAQKNVGDDFAIRELRRNLRAQRQLVIQDELADHAPADRQRADAEESKPFAIVMRLQVDSLARYDVWQDEAGEQGAGQWWVPPRSRVERARV